MSDNTGIAWAAAPKKTLYLYLILISDEVTEHPEAWFDRSSNLCVSQQDHSTP